jgi:hypothetical protein
MGRVERVGLRILAAFAFLIATTVLRVAGIGGAEWLLKRIQARRTATNDVEQSRELAATVDHALYYFDHPSLCLSRSLALTMVLRLCGVDATMVTGIRPVPLKGHAWVEVGHSVVNDDPRVGQIYLPLSRF